MESARERLGAVQRELEEETRLHEENVALNEQLRAQLNELQQHPVDASGAALLAAAESRLAELTETNKRLKRGLIYFFETYYQPPKRPSTADDGGDSEGESVGDEGASKAPQSLRDVVQLLMNLSRNTNEAEQYLSVASISAPYVELLLRSGVAEKHPTNSALLRLSFHV